MQVAAVRWGHWGTPVLLYPTAGGDAEEIERFGLVAALWPLIEAGRIKLYSCDNVPGRAWIDPAQDRRHCAWLQNAYDRYVYHELLPAIRHDCRCGNIEPIVAGASLGALNAIGTICRHPDAFRAGLCMSGTYDLARHFGGRVDGDLYFSSPLHFLPNLGAGDQLRLLRRRQLILAYGGGRWENPDQTWRMAQVLESKGVRNRVIPWGPEWDHDWPTWRAMLPLYLGELA
jgi:esterase/lipase superfamily enzyme